MQKTLKIFIHTVPVLIMVGLIDLIKDDYLLMIIYVAIMIVSLKIFRCNKKDLRVLLFGFVIMIFFEYIFITTGVEVFVRNSLFGVMPIWLPFLWAYGFFAIKRILALLDSFD